MRIYCDNKSELEKNFSRCAHLYDRYANIQSHAANELIKRAPRYTIKDILEIGCGTGNYTLLLTEKFKTARIKAIDISREMVEVANTKLHGRNVEFIVADAEDLDLNEKFDLITSNATFQWFDNLEEAVARYKNAIVEGGVLSFSTFGPMTFWELSRSLKEAFQRFSCEDATINTSNFLNGQELETILGRHLKRSIVAEELIKERYHSLIELLNKIKYTGVRGDGANNHLLWRRDMLKRIEKIYKSMCGQIEATYQIFFCSAVK